MSFLFEVKICCAKIQHFIAFVCFFVVEITLYNLQK